MKLFPNLYSLSSQEYALINNMGWFEGTLWKWTLAWIRELSQTELQQLNELTALLSQHYPRQGQEDIVLWKGQKSYSVKELQRHVSLEVEINSIVCTVWMKLVPPKVEFFMWLTLLGKLNTRQRLCDKGTLPKNQSACTFCTLRPESINHVLLTCPHSQKIWKSIAEEMGQLLTLSGSFKQHYERWMTTSWRNGLSKKVWASTFFAVAWSIWLTRNEIIFQHKVFYHEALCQSIKRRVAFWTKAWKDRLPCTEEEFARNFANISAIFQ